MAKKTDDKNDGAKRGEAEAVPAALLERLDRIETALMTLIDVVKTSGGAGQAAAPTVAQPAPRPPVAPAARPGDPPLIQVAPPARPQPAAVVSIAPAPRARGPVVVPVPEEPALPPVEVPGKAGSVDDVLKRIFEAVTLPVAEQTWAVLTALTHSGQLAGPRSLDHYKAFSWHKARRTAPAYLTDNNPASYTISHMEPAAVAATTERVKIFLSKTDGSLPSPLVLARDPASEGAWRIAQISL